MIQLTIITPDQKVFEGEVEEATFPGANGSFQVLKNHAALVSALAKGTVSYTTKEGKKAHVIDGGVVEVNDNNVVLLAEKVIG
ncbi:ATP synthase epsilon chain [Indibacter alkaliphilus LW1]|jgi:F-type H+-transporting ATPase subunit epsilon|uniref:ATP synthase epsilon chain n=1 Tax=Indibacter alkaliphilus (strain CCUG 57479 / KCTC 22604 / LW1) TaxID=1189612 RepID=S2DLX0_INDAL|nr:ATP synthase F1 subunit epsilon [Indibacter alkaliphilus]EPA00080.1 ATP synthase epsilon chain [Indibacter alkaliphilus LW1]